MSGFPPDRLILQSPKAPTNGCRKREDPLRHPENSPQQPPWKFSTWTDILWEDTWTPKKRYRDINPILLRFNTP